MSTDPLVRTLTELVEPLARSLDLSLWGIELLFSGRSVVRIFVESPQGVTIDQCAELSRLASLSLDVEDLLPGAYVLEVSSPGLERTFFTAAQLGGAVGELVEITLREPLPDFPGRRRFRGVLLAAPAIGIAEAAPADEAAPLAPAAGVAVATGGPGFVLRAEGVVRPGEPEPEVAFAFADLKKAVQVHVPPEKIRPGKGKKAQ